MLVNSLSRASPTPPSVSPAYQISNTWNISGGCYDVYWAILVLSPIKSPLHRIPICKASPLQSGPGSSPCPLRLPLQGTFYKHLYWNFRLWTYRNHQSTSFLHLYKMLCCKPAVQPHHRHLLRQVVGLNVGLLYPRLSMSTVYLQCRLWKVTVRWVPTVTYYHSQSLKSIYIQYSSNKGLLGSVLFVRESLNGMQGSCFFFAILSPYSFWTSLFLMMTSFLLPSFIPSYSHHYQHTYDGSFNQGSIWKLALSQ